MLYTTNEYIQRTAYQLLQRMTRLQIQSQSLLIEMSGSKQNSQVELNEDEARNQLPLGLCNALIISKGFDKVEFIMLV